MPKTLLTTDSQIAARLLDQGEVVAFPTETVYGLGALCDRPEALSRLFELKGRPKDNPLILHIGNPAQVEEYASIKSPIAHALLERFFPGPLTLILPKRKAIPDLITAGLPTIALRCPSHPLAQAMLKALPAGVAAPSANLSGKPSATTWQHVQQDFPQGLGAILQGMTSLGLESTIVDLSHEPVRLLRYGSIPLDLLRTMIPNLQLPEKLSLEVGPPPSPGMKYRHYAPEGEMLLWQRGEELPELGDPAKAAFIGFRNLYRPLPVTYQVLVETAEEYASQLYAFLRACDQQKIELILCEKPQPHGLGSSILNRLEKASSKN